MLDTEEFHRVRGLAWEPSLHALTADFLDSVIEEGFLTVDEFERWGSGEMNGDELEAFEDRFVLIRLLVTRNTPVQ